MPLPATFSLVQDHALSTAAAVESLTDEDFIDKVVKSRTPPHAAVASNGNGCKKLLAAAAWNNGDIAGSVARFLDVARDPEFVPTIIMFKRLCHDEHETWMRAWKTTFILSSYKKLLPLDDDELWETLELDGPPDLTIFRSFEEQKMVASLFETALS